MFIVKWSVLKIYIKFIFTQQVIFRDIYVYTQKYAITRKSYAINLKDIREQYIGGLRDMKGKGEMF